MIIISHRGNIVGPVPDKENRPSYIDSAIQLGYDVEVDLRYVDEEFWLGHDLPQYKINLEWMSLRKDKIWFHCKDQKSSIKLLELDLGLRFFCHSSDDFVLTSTGHLWVHDLSKKISNKCIIPLLSIDDIKSHRITDEFGVCTDYVKFIKNEYSI